MIVSIDATWLTAATTLIGQHFDIICQFPGLFLADCAALALMVVGITEQ